MALILAGAARAPAQDVTGCCQAEGRCFDNVPANMCDGQFVQGGVSGCSGSPR